jgi:hypothetical protein
MPRTGKGGPRNGKVGQMYGNRTDLNTSLPVTTVPGQGYGEAAQQQAAQQTIPMGSTPVPGATAPAPQPQQAPTQQAQMPQATMSDQMTATPQAYPGDLPFLQPTMYPNEPITSGIDSGPGPGSEAISGTPAPVASDLIMAAQRPGASALLMDLAHAAATLGL